MDTRSVGVGGLFSRIDMLEHAWCVRLNRGCSLPSVRTLFAVISRLGDGVFWYAVMLILPVMYGTVGFKASARMVLVGAVGYLIYSYLKSRLVRERPYVGLAGITAGTRALDRYSFPSGHTLHATSFTTLTWTDFPELSFICAPFAVLVAASRVVLGLHYPTDVAAGALLGGALATAAITLIPLG
jgi:undecaprenyl-diphosphatase